MKQLVLLLLLTFVAHGQDKVYEFKIEEGKTLTNFTNSKNGYHFIKTGKQVVMAKFKDDVLVCLDKDLNEVYTVNVNSNDFIGNPVFGDMTYTSNYGSYYNNIDQIIDNKGEVKAYFGTVKQPAKEVEKMSKLNPIFSFFNDHGYTLIGPDIGRKNYKKSYLNGDVKIFNLSNDDFSKFTGDLELPGYKAEVEDENLEWVKGGVFKDSFSLWSFEEIENESGKRIIYYLTIYDFKGKIKSKLKLLIDAQGKRFVSPSVKIYGFTNFLKPEGFNDGLGFFHDENENTFIISGFYSNTKKKKVKELNGVYLCRYNLNGEKVLEKTYAFKEPAKIGNEYQSCLYFETAKEGYFRFSTEEGLFNLFVIDKETGDIKKKYNDILENYKENKANHERKEIKEFISVYSNKEYKKKFFSFKSIHAMLVNPEIKKYINSIKPNNNLYYDATFLEDGGFILKEFDKEKRLIKLLKFN